MKKKSLCFLLAVVCAALFAGAIGSGQAPAPASGAPIPTTRLLAPANATAATPLYFIANEGQMSAEALYCAKTPGYTLWLTREGLVFDRVAKNAQGETIRSRSSLVFLGANGDVEVAAADPSDYVVSYFIGRHESDWKTGIPTSRAVVYRNVYEGIDLKVYGTERRVEYDWIVAPGADPGRIRFCYTGEGDSALNADGDLVVKTLSGRIVQRRPVTHQVVEGRRIEVESAFRAQRDGSYGFALGAYDPSRELTIDPLVLAASTYLGGYNTELTVRVAMDPKGSIYLAGLTYSGDFPPETGGRPRADYFVTKLAPDCSSLIYTAFFPWAYPYHYGKTHFSPDIDVDAKGFVYLAGWTASTGFPLKNAFQKTLRGLCDGFVLKLSRDGRSLLYSSYLGGAKFDYCTSICADGTGAAYVGGETSSRDFPLKETFQKYLKGYNDGFVAKVSRDGRSLLYSTYLGGGEQDKVDAVAVDASGSAVLVGITNSPYFPVKNAFQKTRGGRFDGFITVLTPAGNALSYSSYIGGRSDDYARAVAVDADGACYVLGETIGPIPVKNAFQATRRGSWDAFVLKVDPKQKALVYSSYLGGAGKENGHGIAVDGNGAAYVVGTTSSRSFPLKSPYQASLRGNQDAFLTIVDPAGGKLLLSTFLGGIYLDEGYAIALGADRDILIGGITTSPDLPSAGKAYQDALAGDYDAFVLKFRQANAAGRK